MPDATWYTAGLALGLGVALGVFAAGLRQGIAAVAGGIGAGVLIGVLAWGWPEAVAGGLGGAAGGLAATQIVAGALGRGGTRTATALLVAVGAAALAALALVPALGYVEAIVVPALAARLRARAGRRYAGLRILSR
ncbi:MAG: hypothetical protein WD689_04665 [Gaiellaceae bacterium]